MLSVLSLTGAVVGSVPLEAQEPDTGVLRAQVGALQEQLDRLDAEAGRAAVAHNRALDRRDDAQRRVGEVRRERVETRRTLQRARGELADRLVQLYVSPPPDLVEFVLSSGSLSDLHTATQLLDAAARGDAELVGDIRARAERLTVLEGRLRRQEAEAQRQVRIAEVERRRVAELLQSRRERLTLARTELRRALERRAARLRALAAAKRAAARARVRAAEAPVVETPSGGAFPVRGDYVYPLAGPSTFSDDWLAARAGRRLHEGIDLFAARGTPVIAVADGTLFRVGYSGISGNRLWLRDDRGTEYFYAHLDGYSAAAREGARVRRGTVLGFNGDTGDARGTPPHVHFEIHPGGGGPIRPYPIVSSWPRAG